MSDDGVGLDGVGILIWWGTRSRDGLPHSAQMRGMLCRGDMERLRDLALIEALLA